MIVNRMTQIYHLYFLFASFLFTVVHSWGSLGHRLSGLIAEEFLDPHVATIMQSLLPDAWKGNLGRASTWADEIKSNPKYGWSSKLHYIDVVNATIGSCSVDFERDCTNKQCVISAIHNFTDILDTYHSKPSLHRSSIDWKSQSEALMFLVHFYGDIAQPLHNCGMFRGGNDYFVTFDNQTTYKYNGRTMRYQMHVVWDVMLLEKDIKLHFNQDPVEYAAKLVYDLESGDYSTIKNDWIKCTHPYTTKSGLLTTACPLDWSQNANALNCDSVWVGHKDDLGQAYFIRNAPFIREAIAKAGYRLATFLNAFFTQNISGSIEENEFVIQN